jgi:hypothetical protein
MDLTPGGRSRVRPCSHRQSVSQLESKSMTDNPERPDIPVVFTPANEPYLGRQALLTFDREIPFSLWVSSHIAAYTRQNGDAMSDLQRAACQIVPQGINLALSIREHGDPVAADWNRVQIDDNSLGYAVGKVLNAPTLCDELAIQGRAYLRVLIAKATSCFPEVKPPGALTH